MCGKCLGVPGALLASAADWPPCALVPHEALSTVGVSAGLLLVLDHDPVVPAIALCCVTTLTAAPERPSALAPHTAALASLAPLLWVLQPQPTPSRQPPALNGVFSSWLPQGMPGFFDGTAMVLGL